MPTVIIECLCRELLLIEGISLQGLGNWQAIAEHVGTRTKEEVEEHYNSVFIESPNWPLPVRSVIIPPCLSLASDLHAEQRMDAYFNIDPSEFQERKRRRISTMNTAPPPPKDPPTSAPGVHEVATFLPGRLEFEHELDNEAEDLVKDLEFGLCYEWGGDAIMEDENDHDVKARARWEEEKKERESQPLPTVTPVNGFTNSGINGFYGMNGIIKRDAPSKSEDRSTDDNGPDDDSEENMPPIPLETQDSLAFKLTLLQMYAQRIEKRHEAKAIMFDRGLLEYKKVLFCLATLLPNQILYISFS